ncbi:MAG: 3-phosphoserine/phosphohydroxythreonine transaminase [Fimbriimonadaceae bacterium]
MSQPYDRVFNFSAGPCTLPVPVLEQARDEMLNWRGVGMGVMEMSHRGKAFESILADAIADLRTLVGISEDYEVLFLQGGASLQFDMVATNFLTSEQVGQYIVTGTWGKKAVGAAKHWGNAATVWDGKDFNYDRVPNLSDLSLSENRAYLHITSNETIQGVDFLSDPVVEGELVCDMSSNILSRPFDVNRYALIYAGAQKNMGPAGATLVIIRKDFLERAKPGLTPMLSYAEQASNDSMYNTPPCWSIYICGLVYKWLLGTGGLTARAEINERKAAHIYQAIDQSKGFYTGHAQPECRSLMNITFTLPSEELTDTFVKGAKSAGMDGIKGHRSVGGIRASIYNAFPEEGCQALADFMREFAAKNG